MVDLPNEDPTVIETMIAYFYTQTFDVSSSKTYDVLWRLTEIYKAAGYYGAQGLKTCCISKVSNLLKQCKFDEDDFLHCAKLVWTTTPDSDMGLRDLYVSYLRSVRHTLTKNKDLIEKLKTVDGFVADILAAEWA